MGNAHTAQRTLYRLRAAEERFVHAGTVGGLIASHFLLSGWRRKYDAVRTLSVVGGAAQ
jgi:hypothetical protein